MYQGLIHQGHSALTSGKTRSISPENFTGEKGGGARATEGTGKHCARELGVGWKISPSISIAPGETFPLACIDGPGMIRHIWMTETGENRSLILRMYWDDAIVPSVEVPLGDFFACADCQTYDQVTSAVVCVNPKRAFNCYWEMPFYRNARITLENIGLNPITVYYQIDYVLDTLPAGLGYFHAQFRRVNPLKYKDVYTILDNVHGRGKYVGTYLYWGANNDGWWGEGEVKFYLDGDGEFPTICGTGAEDYFCGSWNFDVDGRYQEYCTPYAGLAKVSRPDGFHRMNQRFSLYRWHLPDPINFETDLRVTIQALGWRSADRYLPLRDDISSVAYWYMDRICDSFPELPSVEYLEIY